MKKMICLILSILLLGAMTLSLAACGAKASVEKPHNLTEDVTAHPPAEASDPAMAAARLTDFGLRLFREGQTEGKNTLYSPLSVLCALSMTANGAQGETRTQMEAALGMKVEDLNAFLYAYIQELSREGDDRMSLANSIWFTDDERFTVNRDFLQTNADYYGADLYRAPFNDATCKAINDWVKNKTDGMIPQILDRIPADAVMCLVNALAFEAEWVEPYEKTQVTEAPFTLEDGTKRTVELMRSRENAYLEDDNATGFIKYYAGGRYAFAALLPNEGVTVADYLDSLTGESLHRLLAHPRSVPVSAALPKFETDFDAELVGVLAAMGMPLAFDPDQADFSALGTSTDGNIYIGSVIHKTFISVAEQGTRAGAATVVVMVDGCALEEEPPKVVTLDRPFVYMLIDTATGTPFFIGTMMDPGE